MITTEERIALAERAHADGRIIQGAWRRDEGRELVCALAAFGPDINSASDCPADLMPQWLAELVPTLDDGIAAADVPWFMGELLARAKRWHVLDANAWERVRTGFLIATVRDAYESAVAVQPNPLPEYFIKIRDAVDRVIAALEGKDDPDAARAAAADAAWAARAAAADAAWAARRTARAARAARRTARAARAADAAWAASAAAAADAAWAASAAAAADAAWAASAAAAARRSCETLFAMIDAELRVA